MKGECPDITRATLRPGDTALVCPEARDRDAGAACRTAASKMKIHVVQASFSAPHREIREFWIDAAFLRSGGTRAHAEVEIVVPGLKGVPAQAGQVKDRRRLAILRVLVADVEIVLKDDVGTSAGAAAADVIAGRAVAKIGVVLKRVGPVIDHNEGDAVSCGATEEGQVPVVSLGNAIHGRGEPAAIVDRHVIAEEDGVHGAELPLLAHVAVGL